MAEQRSRRMPRAGGRRKGSVVNALPAGRLLGEGCHFRFRSGWRGVAAQDQGWHGRRVEQRKKCAASRDPRHSQTGAAGRRCKPARPRSDHHFKVGASARKGNRREGEASGAFLSKMPVDKVNRIRIAKILAGDLSLDRGRADDTVLAVTMLKHSSLCCDRISC